MDIGGRRAVADHTVYSISIHDPYDRYAQTKLDLYVAVHDNSCEQQ
jgi:hypothetical protein